jgi:S-DNA-T family DNA segregation ATPase FtsK/SpoIIIE
MVRVTVLDLKGMSIGQTSPYGGIPGATCSDVPQIERRLDEILGHMKMVGRERLGSGCSTLLEYNAWARSQNSPCEPYHILIVQDCGASQASSVIQKIGVAARNGGRCGVFSLVHWGDSCEGHALDALTSIASGSALIMPGPNGTFTWKDEAFADCQLDLDGLPSNEVATQIVNRASAAWQAKSAKTVDYEEATKGLSGGGLWGESSERGIRAPLGIAESGKLVWLEIGEGLKHNTLIIGAPGSGKTNIMHVGIIGLAERYSPEELQLYLLDFKGGVAFKSYAVQKLPHASVIAIDCDREFGLSALEGLVEKMQRRMDLFRSVLAEDIAMYRKQTGKQLPRILMVADEFQELFVEDDAISQRARVALDGLLRKGRGFGVHLLLGTQTLRGVSARCISLELIAVRLAMRCSEEDSRLVLSQNNLAGAMLSSEPGDCIYNADSGRLEANIRFRAADLKPSVRAQRLDKIAAKQQGKWNSVVFEGNEPASIESSGPWIRLNSLTDDGGTGAGAPNIWLGESVAIQGPTGVCFERRRGRHLLAVMQKPEQGLAPLFNALLVLLAHYKPGGARFSILNVLDNDSPWSGWPGRIKELFDSAQLIENIGREQLAEFLPALAEDVKQVAASAKASPPHFLFVLGLQLARELRSREAYSPREPDTKTCDGAFVYVLKEGAEHDVHVLAWCDLLSNVVRTGRTVLEEFGVRLAGEMTQSDSAACVGTLDAARLRKNNRAVVYDEAKPGTAQILRPYSLPSFALFERMGATQMERNRGV